MSGTNYIQVINVLKKRLSSEEIAEMEEDIQHALGMDSVLPEEEFPEIPWEGCTLCRLQSRQGGLSPIWKGDGAVLLLEYAPWLMTEEQEAYRHSLLAPLASWYLTSLVKCYQPRFEMQADGPLAGFCPDRYLEEEIESVNPQGIVCFGEDLLELLTGEKGLERARQAGLRFEYLGRPLIPTFDPSLVREEDERVGRLRTELARDLERAQELVEMR